jgi:predicted P-loop ATPase
MKITIISSTQPPTLTKHIAMQPDGTLSKTSSAHMTKGHADVHDVTSMTGLNALLDGLQSNQAVAYGTPPVPSAPIVSEKYLATTPGAITRSDKSFAWPKGGGFMYLDYDPGANVLGRDALIGTLFSVLPVAASAGWLWRPSASGNIFDASTGEELAGLKGQHIYIAVKDVADVPRAGGVLFKRMWLNGHGRIEIAQNGAALVRGLIDAAVWQPSRLDFAAGAVCGTGLVRYPPAGLAVEGGLLDTVAALPDLSAADEKRYAELVYAAKQAAAPASAAQRETHIHTVAVQQNVSPEEVRARYDVAEEKGILSNDFPIELAYDRGVITVADVLADPAKYHGMVCLDPLEPDYNNRHPVGKIYNDSKGAFLDSKAHGGRIFSLGDLAALAFKQMASEGATFKDLMASIRRDACDLAEVQRLVGEINDGPFCAMEVTLLRAELEGNLKENKRLTPEVKAVIHGAEVKKPATLARDYMPENDTSKALSQSEPINPRHWHHDQTSGRDEKPLGTVDNFRVMAAAYNVQIEFNEISKELTMRLPGFRQGGSLQDEAALSHMTSLANLNRYPKGDVPGMVCALANENYVNPVRDMVNSAPWDGRDHVGELFSQVVLDPEEDAAVCEMLFRRWMRGAVSCGTGYAFGFESAIVWVDEKGGAGKTRFFKSLCAPELRADGLILDTTDKDSVKTAISHWLVELGELDGTFNKSAVAELKAFMSRQVDDIRLPYARTSSKFPRMTAFMGSVNQTNFLVDETGNRRFWPIRVTHINHEHTVNVQQAWAQAMAEVVAGQTWHLSPEENNHCAQRNEVFRAVSRVDELLSSRIDLESRPSVHMTCTELATAIGMSNAHKGELNEVARWLRAHGVSQLVRSGRRGFLLAPLRSVLVDAALALVK